ncbi:MAG: hypothetical protein ACRDYF_17420 [Acidimicrobiia bacterium]
MAPDGSLLIADTANYRVRRVDPTGIITTIAGTGERGYSGDGGPVTAGHLPGSPGGAMQALADRAPRSNNRLVERRSRRSIRVVHQITTPTETTVSITVNSIKTTRARISPPSSSSPFHGA